MAFGVLGSQEAINVSLMVMGAPAIGGIA